MIGRVILASILWLPASFPNHAFGEKAEKFAGIEVGGKGVKAIILTVEVKEDVLSIFQRADLELGKTANTTLAKVNEKNELDVKRVKDTGIVIKNCISMFNDQYQIKNDKIYIAISSGVSKAPNLSILDDEIQKVLGRIPAHLRVEDEVSYAILGLMGDKDRNDTALLDFGSSNVKGGYCEPGSRNTLFRFCTFTNERIPGTVEFGKLRQRHPNLPISELRTKAIEDPIDNEIEVLPMMRNAKRYYLCGGFVWAMTRLLYPEKLHDEFIPLTIQDFALFRTMLGNGRNFPKARMERIVVDDALRLEAEAELATVRRVFTPENLNDGAEVFAAVINSCRLDGEVEGESKLLLFPRDAMFAWLLSFVRDNAFRGRSPRP